jgi:transposase
VDQGDTGPEPAAAAQAPGICREGVQLPAAQRGLVLRPRRWLGERRFAWAARFRRRSRDDERGPETIAGRHFLVLACLMLVKAAPLLHSS